MSKQEMYKGQRFEGCSLCRVGIALHSKYPPSYNVAYVAVKEIDEIISKVDFSTEKKN